MSVAVVRKNRHEGYLLILGADIHLVAVLLTAVVLAIEKLKEHSKLKEGVILRLLGKEMRLLLNATQN